MKFALNTLIAICSLSTATQVVAHRGNDFGNGGDPIREVFNAGRVFALDLLQGSKNEQLLAGLSAPARATYLNLEGSAVGHLSVAEHQWGDWSQSTCARTTMQNVNIINMSYDVCAAAAPNAVAATRILLESALRSHAGVADFADTKAIAEHLVAAWESVNPDTYAKAKAFSLSRGTVTGAWICGGADAGQTFSIEVSSVGLVKAPLAIFPGSSVATDKLEFVSFLTLNQTRDQFRAQGLLKRSRPAAQEHDNVIYGPTCNYPFALDLIQTADQKAMTVQFGASGMPQWSDGCGVGSKITRSLVCKRP